MVSMKRPAILGGPKSFEKLFPIVNAVLPPWSDISTQVEAAYVSKHLSNFGPYSIDLEKSIGNLLDCRYVLSIANATIGLQLALVSIVSRGREVLVPSFTFAATVDAILANNLIPRFIDIELDTWNLSVEAIEKSIGTETAAIMPVHVFGNPCDVAGISELGKKYDIPILYDSAHALGSSVKDKPMGSNGTCEVFSLSITKLLPAGEGGVITTNYENIATKLMRLRNYGYDNGYQWSGPGGNGKLIEIAAIIALQGVPSLNNAVKNRCRYASLYRKHLESIPGISFQKVHSHNKSSFKDFAILINEEDFGTTRDVLSTSLEAENIQTRPYFFPPLHLTRFGNRFINLKDSLDTTERISKGVLCLPIYSIMEESDIFRVCYSIISIHRFAEEVNRFFGYGSVSF